MWLQKVVQCILGGLLEHVSNVNFHGQTQPDLSRGETKVEFVIFLINPRGDLRRPNEREIEEGFDVADMR
jgi:hypothetical protein